MIGDGKIPPNRNLDEVFWRYRLADLVIDLSKSFCSETTELIYRFQGIRKDDYRDRRFFNTHCQHPIHPWEGEDEYIIGTITIRRHGGDRGASNNGSYDGIRITIDFFSILDASITETHSYEDDQRGRVLFVETSVGDATSITAESSILLAMHEYHRNDVDYGSYEKCDRINPWDYYILAPSGFGTVSLKKGIPIKRNYGSSSYED